MATGSELDDQLAAASGEIFADHRVSVASTSSTMREHLDELAPDLWARAKRVGLCDPSDSQAT